MFGNPFFITTTAYIFLRVYTWIFYNEYYWKYFRWTWYFNLFTFIVWRSNSRLLHSVSSISRGLHAVLKLLSVSFYIAAVHFAPEMPTYSCIFINFFQKWKFLRDICIYSHHSSQYKWGLGILPPKNLVGGYETELTCGIFRLKLNVLLKRNQASTKFQEKEELQIEQCSTVCSQG